MSQQHDPLEVAGNVEAATPVADKRLNAEHAFKAANALARGGQVWQAIRMYRELLSVRPDFVEAHANLAFVLNAMHRFSEAEPHFRRVLEARPDEVPVLMGLARALHREGRWEDAEQHYRHALTLQPRQVEALLGVGVCLRSRSRLDEACDCFERAARVDPDCVDAYYLMSTLRHSGVDDSLLAQCEALQGRVAGLPPLKQARYRFALGRMREDAGRYDEAFAAYQSGNRIRARLFVLDESGEDESFRRTREVFDERMLSRPATLGVSSDRVPVFIVGMPRSGTSLIEQIVATHPDVHGAGEIPDLWDVVRERIGNADAWPEAALEFPPESWRKLGEAYLDRIWRRAPDATHIVNKMPLNCRHVGMIRMMLPRARIIHAARDPMDSCLSCYTRLFDGDNLAYTYDLASLGRYYVRYAKLMQHWHALLPADAILDVHYEDLVTDTERAARALLEYLGLAWDPCCLDFHRNTRVVATASRAQVRRPVYRSSVGRWKHFEAHLGPLLDLVGPWRWMPV